jgi:hypothetical protein
MLRLSEVSLELMQVNELVEEWTAGAPVLVCHTWHAFVLFKIACQIFNESLSDRHPA